MILDSAGCFHCISTRRVYAAGSPGQSPATVLPVPWLGRYRAMLTAPALLGAVVVIQVATADQPQESVAQTWIGSLFVGERATECQMPGSCLVSMAECIPETDAGPPVKW